MPADAVYGGTPGTAALRPARDSLVLVTALAAACAEVSGVAGERWPLVEVVFAVGLAALVALAARWFQPPSPTQDVPYRLGAALLLLALVLPYPLEPLRLALTNQPRPLELLLIDSLRNVLLVLVLLRAWPLFLRLAGLVSLFLVLFATSVADDPPLLAWLMAGYVAAAAYWMALLFWAGLGRGSARPPWPALAAVLLLVSLSVGVGLAGPVRAARLLGELVPTSGGTGSYDPAARGGLNDGDDEVAGPNAKTAGFIESDVFIEDDRPSLYDAVNDTYGEPFRTKELDRAVMVNAEQVIDLGKRAAENLRARREFSTSRRGPKNSRHPADRNSEALFFVSGPTPLHLRMTVHDRFDGVAWKESPPLDQPCLLAGPPEGGWIRLARANRPDIDAAPVRHELRIARLESYQFPTPVHLSAFRLGRVDQPEFFGQMHEGILRLRPRKIPAGVTLLTESHTVDPAKLAGLDPFFAITEQYTQLPTLDPRIGALAREWAKDRPRGWQQIDAVTAALRKYAVRDDGYSTPPDCPDAVAHFLFESRRGPDYLFASALAVLLRSLNYPVRLVSGFYAAPERYDRYSRITPVCAEDVHFWPEVQVSGWTWLVVEPTPGYEVAGPGRTWLERLIARLASVFGWVRDQAAVLSLAALTAAALVWQRRRLIDWAGLWWWGWRSRRGWRASVLAALWLIERRQRWAGMSRPAGRAPARWFERDEELAWLAELTDWAAFAPAACEPPCPAPAIVERCRQALTAWPTARFRRARTEGRA